MFDDFLNLKSQSFKDAQLITFVGRSGSGKSTSLKYLIDHHPDFEGAAYHWLELPNTAALKQAFNANHMLVLDDVTGWCEYIQICKLLIRGQRIAMAAHTPYWALCFLKLFTTHQIYKTDCDASKLKRFLKQQKLSFSEPILNDYMRRYKANYSDMRLIIDHTSETISFDRAYINFHRYCQISHCIDG